MKFQIFWLGLLLFCLTGCGESTYLSHKPSPKPYGNYIFNITISDLANEPLGFSKYLGWWELQLEKTNIFSFSLDGIEVDEGVYEWTDNQLIFYSGNKMNCSSFQEDEPSGIYNWNFDGKALTLSKVVETCYGRGIILRAHSLTKST